jgi:hypothetical protein
MTIYTAHWQAKLPQGHTRVRISRGGPRWLPAGSYKSYSAFFPGKWFKSAGIPRPLQRHPCETRSQARCGRAGGLWSVSKGRHIAAQWLEDSLGIKVEEVGHPDLSRSRYLRGEHFAPSYVRREPGYSAQPPRSRRLTRRDRSQTDMFDLLAIAVPATK